MVTLRTWCAVILPLACLVGCGPGFEADARETGSEVSVNVLGLKDGDIVSVRGMTTTATSHRAVLKIPAETLGAGEHELQVEVKRGDKVKTKQIKVKVTEAALAPRLSFDSCQDPPEGGPLRPLVKLESKLWTVGKKSCALHPSGEVKVNLTANADAEVKLGGQPVSLAEGKGTGALSVAPLLSKLSLRGLADRKARGSALPLQVTAEASRGGKTASFPITLEVTHDSVRGALFDNLLQLKEGSPVTWPRKPHTGKPRGVALATQRTEVSVDGKPRKVLSDAYVQVMTAGGDFHADEIDLFAVATPNPVNKRPACTGYTVLSGTGGIRNTGFTFGLKVEVFDHEGKKLATRQFDAPTKTRCPASLSGKSGETKVLLWGPDPEDVNKWLEALRGMIK